MKIIFSSKKIESDIVGTPVKTINYSGVKNALNSHKNPERKKTVAAIAFEKLCVKFMKVIVLPQVKESYCLNLSNNVEIAETLGCSSRQVRKIREKLSAAGVLFVPAWGKQKKKGDWPVWMIAHSFLKFEVNEEVAANPSVSVKVSNSKYKPEFWAIREEAKVLARRTFLSEFERAEIPESERVISGRVYMTELWSEFDSILRVRGLTRSDLLK